MSNLWGPTSKSRGRFRTRSLHFGLLPSGTTNVLITWLSWGQDLPFQEVVVSVPVSFSLASFSALSCCHGDGSLPFAIGGDGAVWGGAALMFVFEFKRVTAGGRGGRSWCRGRRGWERLCLWRLWGVRNYSCNLIGCQVFQLGGRSFGALESVGVKDGLPLLRWFIDWQLGGYREWTAVVWNDRHTSNHHLGPCAATMLLLQHSLHTHALRVRHGLKRQGRRRFCIRAAILKCTGSIAAASKVCQRSQASCVKGNGGERFVHVPINLRLLSDLPPLPRDTTRASASDIRAEDVRLCRAVVFQVAAVSGVDLRQQNAAIGLFRWIAQALKDVLAWCAVRKKLWDNKEKKL